MASSASLFHRYCNDPRGFVFMHRRAAPIKILRASRSRGEFPPGAKDAASCCRTNGGTVGRTGRLGSVAPAQQSESFVVLNRARIWPEADRTLAFAHGLGERGKSAMVVGIATCHSRSRSSSRGREPTFGVMQFKLLNMKRKETRMHWTTPTRVIAMAAIITSLAVPALAQEGDPSKSEANKAEERKKKESEEVERAYQDMLK